MPVDSVALDSAAPRKNSNDRVPPRGLRTRVIAVGAAWTTLWWTIIGLLIAPVVPGGWLTIALAALIAFTPMLLLVQQFGGYTSAFTRVWVLRPFLYLQTGAPPVAIAGVLGALIGAFFGHAADAGRGAAVAAAAITVGAAVLGYAGTRRLRVAPFTAPFPDLPVEFEGLRVVQITDLHVGPQTPRAHLSRIVRAVESAEPDVIAITGDQVDYARDVAVFASVFGRLSAPLGVFVVPGNHDVYAGWPEVRAGLEAMGATVLVNDAVPVMRGSQRLWVAGTGDPAGHGSAAAPDIIRTLTRVPDGAFTLALAHNPALWPALAARGVQLTLSGHTHHGQISIPRLGWSLASLFLELAMGWYRRGGSLLYINPGTNYWGLPLRIGAIPEVTIVTLTRSSSTALPEPS
jgi:predicted MPP superfamily phosphohydrolase